jgi:bacillithiol synthase
MSVRTVAMPPRLPEIAVRADRDPVVSSWFGGGIGATDWERRAVVVGRARSDSWLDALQPALNPSGMARERLERVREDGFVVTTGQQPGLFGGPLYTWHKALTALALADELEHRLGVPVAPVFWAATDDSDLAEATITTVSVPGGYRTITLDRVVERDTPMSAVPVGDVADAMSQLDLACGSAPNAGIVTAVREAYRPDNTLGGAYLELLRSVLEPQGIAVLDAAHPATRAAGENVSRSALRRANAIAAALRERHESMAAAGIRPQVRHVPSRTLVFSVNGDRRSRIRMSEAVEAAERAGADELSPNVLLRPIVERCILPTLAYVAGPSEIAYFAQVSAVAAALEIDPPHVVPRWSGYIIEPHIDRVLETLRVDVEDLRDPHAVEGRLARGELPGRVRDAVTATRSHVRDLAPDLLDAIRENSLDVPRAAVHGAVGQLEHKLDRLERRLVAAVKRRGSDALRQLATARGALYPRNVAQERALNVVPLIARHGDEPLEGVLAAARAYVAEL